jgi:hypothetical protein
MNVRTVSDPNWHRSYEGGKKRSKKDTDNTIMSSPGRPMVMREWALSASEIVVLLLRH